MNSTRGTSSKTDALCHKQVGESDAVIGKGQDGHTKSCEERQDLEDAGTVTPLLHELQEQI